MRAKALKKKYPEIWEEVFKGVLNDLLTCMPGCDINFYEETTEPSRISRIAHNAAFFACNAVHHEVKKAHLKSLK
jgi:hypothetical protein